MTWGTARLGRIAVIGVVVGSSLTLLAPNAAATDIQVTASDVATGLTIPWDLTFTPDGTMLYNQRGGVLSARLTNGTTRNVAADFSDVWVAFEAGLMGMVVDPDYASNRYLYTCQSWQGGAAKDVRVIKWLVAADFSTATRVGNPLVTGMQVTGRHAGCRLRFDTNKLLYIGTGDAAIGTNPQDLTSLNGKVLRITTAGVAAPGNPFLTSPNANTKLIYTYGHRNAQGLSLRPGTNDMWAVEQGTDSDDEVNRLVAGANYGYDPVPGYNEAVPMTDLVKYPTAKEAVFKTGNPTLALSGGTWLSGPEWGRWNGTFVAAALKAISVRVLTIAGTDGLARVESPPELQVGYGRLRTPQLGPDGALYLMTSNGGGQDRILRLTPTVRAGDTRCAGDAAPASPVGALTVGGTTRAYAIGTNYSLYYRSISAGAAFGNLPGQIRYGPAVASWGGNRTDVFVVGVDGILNHRYGTGTNVINWSADWERLGGFLTSSPTVVSFSTGTLDIFARGGDNALWTIRWTGAAWSGWSRLGGVLSSAPGAAVDLDTGTARVGVRGTDGRLYEMTRTAGGSGGSFGGPGPAICSAPSYAARSGDGEAFTLAYVNADGGTEVVNAGFVQSIGGIVQGSAALTLTGAAGFAVFGRGLNGELWTFDARTGAGAWRSLGGQIV